MPMYEYECRKCGKTFDHLARSMAARDEVVACPSCGGKQTARKLSVFAVGAGAAKPAARGPMPGCCACGREPGSCGMNG